MATRKKTPDFETSLDELEVLVESLEEGSLSLEEALKAFERGVRITRECQQALKNAEQKVIVLMADAQGAISEADFVESKEEQP